MRSVKITNENNRENISQNFKLLKVYVAKILRKINEINLE